MRKHTVYLGIDPGASGAIAALDPSGDVWGTIKNSETPADIADWLAGQVHGKKAIGVIEKVHAMPKQGVSSTFKFGTSYGFLLGLLVANKVEFMEVTPQRWQADMGCLSGGDKNRTKKAAQSRFPHLRITHAIADALLLSDFCRMSHVYMGSACSPISFRFTGSKWSGQKKHD